MKNAMLLACRIPAALAALYLAFTFTACTPRMVPPLFVDETFAKTPVTEPIYLLPVVDLRVDKSKDLKLNDNALKRLSPTFEKRGYGALRPLTDRALVESLIEDDFTHPDPEILSSLGPENSRWLFCPLLHDLKSKITFGSTANAEISGYLIDKERGTIVWRHKGVGQAGQGGVLGMAMKGVIEEEAVNSAFLSLAAAVPQNGGIANVEVKK
ncbi:MAG: hypothetical protein EP344_11085 [Bacteroidetes bacterium]|nr:MAG: hypothetical protein EP344_11085 [Bacteroidota bacterium]